MGKIREWVLNAVYPRRCPVCDQVLHGMDQLVCKTCRNKLLYVKEPACKICGKPILYENGERCGDCQEKHHIFRQNKAVFVYQKEMKESMYRFKYANKREYADFYIEQAVAQYGDWLKEIGVERIIPIPLHKSRKRMRGYNQSEVLAKKLSEHTGIAVDRKCLKRMKRTRPQKELNEAERKKNLKNAFKTTTDGVQLRKILLVDDIYTTGSTLDAAAAAMKASGVEQVYGLCICIGQTY